MTDSLPLILPQFLPDGEGIQLLRLALTHPPDTARAFITAHPEPAMLQQAINDLQISYYIAKPVELPQLQSSYGTRSHSTARNKSHRSNRTSTNSIWKNTSLKACFLIHGGLQAVPPSEDPP